MTGHSALIETLHAIGDGWGADLTGHQTVEGVARKAAEALRSLTAENERLRTERDGWLKIVGDLASSIPIPKVLSATGTAGDLIAYFKKLHQRAEAAEAEAAKLREALKIARGYVGRWNDDVLLVIDAALKETDNADAS